MCVDELRFGNTSCQYLFFHAFKENDMEYQIITKTGNESGSDCGSDVEITLYGEKGGLQSFTLDGGKYFGKGEYDKITVNTRDDLGRINMIKLEMMPSSSNPTWLCESVSVQRKGGDEDSISKFEVYCWFEKGKLERTFKINFHNLENTNVKVKDIFSIFDSIGKKCTHIEFKANAKVDFVSHVQGFIYHNNHGLVSYSNKGQPKGFFLIVNTTEQRRRIETHDEGFNHPGGMQVVGDYLAVGVEDSNDKKGSHLRFYNIKDMSLDQAPSVIVEKDIFSTDLRASSVGITNCYIDGHEQYILCQYRGGGKIALHTANASEGFINAEFTLNDKNKAIDVEKDLWTFLLVTQEKNENEKDDRVFMIGLRSNCNNNSDKIPTKNLISLFEIKFEIIKNEKKDKIYFSIDRAVKDGKIIPEMEVDVDHGCYFRYGAGLQIVGKDEIKFWATERDATSTETVLDAACYCGKVK